MQMNYGGLNLHNCDLELTAGLINQLNKNGVPQIAFSGRSNVGKSTLVNCLLGRKKFARVSASPGKTITVNYYNVDKKMSLVDLPGYGYAKRSKSEEDRWSSLVEAYFDKNSSLKYVLQLIDSRSRVTIHDATMLNWLAYYNVPYCVVITKCDKLNKTELKEAIDDIKASPYIKRGINCIPFSGLNGTGRDEVWECIISQLL